MSAAGPGGGSPLRFVLNGQPASYDGDRGRRLSEVLREGFGFTGVKTGCDAGDCGACTVLVDGRQHCTCLMAVGQVEGALVASVEGLLAYGRLSRIQNAFLKHGAAQCGFCTPGMIMAATDLLAETGRPTEREVRDAIAGVLCRCTGYRKIVAAAMDGDANPAPPEPPPPGAAVGARMAKRGGVALVDGSARFGADGLPADALWLRAIRSPHDAARFRFGDLAGWLARHPGLRRVLTAADLPMNGFGTAPERGERPVLADGTVRHRGEAVAAVLGERAAVEALDPAAFPIDYAPLPALAGIEAAMAPDAPPVNPGRRDNLVTEGRVRAGDAEAAFAAAGGEGHLSEAVLRTAGAALAGLEPEAGWARREGERVALHVSARAPHAGRDATAHVLGLEPAQLRILRTGCGGRLDPPMQALLALAARLEERPVACLPTRPESMAAAVRGHAARIHARFACDREGRLTAAAVAADFDGGAYACPEPALAGQVPVHAAGPYRVPAVANRAAIWFSNGLPAGACRGLGLAQAAIAHEAAMDDLALSCGIDRLEFRLRNALRSGDRTATGQVLRTSAGLPQCLEALRPHWQRALARAAVANAQAAAAPHAAGRALRHGVGLGCMWCGIGGPGMSAPPEVRVALHADGRLVFHGGAGDAGRGADTALAQILADAVGLGVERFAPASGDTALAADAGSAAVSSRTYAFGKAAELAALAGLDLRAAILRLAGAGPQARLALHGRELQVAEGAVLRGIDLAGLPRGADGVVLQGVGRFASPVGAPDGDGQGSPHAGYAFAAQMAELQVDLELGIVTLHRIVAAHDVGRAINPQLVEGRIEGGIARGIGLALMEEYLPGRTETLRDYLIPTSGDVPEIEILLVEDPDPVGPHGAKGLGAAVLGPTAPAILGAIRHATGLRIAQVPALPHRILEGLRQSDG